MHLTGAGTCQITASQAGNDQLQRGLERAAVVHDREGGGNPVAFGPQSHLRRRAQVSDRDDDPSGLSVVSVTYDGSATAPTNAGAMPSSRSLTNANYTAPNATGTLVIAKATAIVSGAGRQDLRRRSVQPFRVGLIGSRGELRAQGRPRGSSAAP